MNDYELALQNIKDALDMLHRHIYDGTFNHPYWSISKIQELIDKDKKYAWHDLRENPDDLPKSGEYVYTYHIGGYGIAHKSFVIKNRENFIAWCEINPYEEVTE